MVGTKPIHAKKPFISPYNNDCTVIKFNKLFVAFWIRWLREMDDQL